MEIIQIYGAILFGAALLCMATALILNASQKNRRDGKHIRK